MAKINEVRRIVVEDFKTEDRDLANKLAFVLNPFFNSIVTALNNGLTIQDNINAEIREIEFTTTSSYEETIITSEANLLDNLPVSTVIMYAGSDIPNGYILCNGSDVSRTTYNALFLKIGTTYGAGDGTTTFTLPNPTGSLPFIIKV